MKERPGNGNDIWKITRPDLTSNWSNPINVGVPINTAVHEWDPEISADNLTLFFDRTDPDHRNIYFSQRIDNNSAWETPQKLLINVSESGGSSISSDGLLLLFHSDRPGGYGARDIWYSFRNSFDDPWGVPINAGLNINSLGEEVVPDISLINNTLYFTRIVNGQRRIFYSVIIPEPSMLLAGLLTLLRLRRRTR